MTKEEELNKINMILDHNKHKSFVKRILEPEKYPKLDRGKGVYSTHSMAWGETGPKDKRVYHVFPTVFYDKKNNKLVDYSNRKPMNNALRHNQTIHFKTAEEADWFSKNYKKVWDKK